MDLSRLDPRDRLPLKAVSAPLRQLFSRVTRLEDGITQLRHDIAALDAKVEVPEPPATAAGFTDFNLMLHDLRGFELARMPRITGTMLSAGCAGAYYFEWIRSTYGPVPKHIGLELFLPEPPELPDYVEWIARSCIDMEGIEDESVELLFSGQNIEHLYGSDVVDFLLESHRVIQPGGWLVVDSPNRLVTQDLLWSMPEHTVEFTPDEIRELMTLAGFDVESIRGQWLCREPSTNPDNPDAGRLYDLWGTPGQPLPDREVVRRIAIAGDHPEHSFSWWAEARRSGRAPDVEGLRRRHTEIYAEQWPARMNRLRSVVGVRDESGPVPVVRAGAMEPGFLMYGPYTPFPEGDYVATVKLRRTGPTTAGEIARIDICAGEDSSVELAERSLTAEDLPDGQWVSVDLPFTADSLLWYGQVRVLSHGMGAIEVEMAVALDEKPRTG